MEFKFKVQSYQTDAAKAVTDVFIGQPNAGAMVYLRDAGRTATYMGMESFLGGQGEASEGYGNALVKLTRDQLLSNIQRIQESNHIQESLELHNQMGACELDVEMETGTGKTYVYTKTIFELNRLYGWTKFIVVVPSVAIREGIYKSLQGTEQHFFEQYGKRINYFIYNSSRLNELDAYSQSSDINLMIINMQAFNTSMKESGSSKEARVMYSERDDFNSRRPIDVLSANRPIIIQDEPQKMGGAATQAGIKRFKPLFCLNYSATIKNQKNMVYELDTLDAYNKRLVKRIEVKGFELKNMRGTDGYLYLSQIIVSENRAPQAVLEYKKLNASGTVRKVSSRFSVGCDVYIASEDSSGNGLEAYRGGYVIAPDGIVPDQNGRTGYVCFMNGIILEKGQVYGDSSGGDMRRVQIRETIQSHLQKEEALFHRGIKCLSLFFIDEVAKYRAYGEDGEELTVGYGKVFEEEYEAAVRARLSQPTTDDLIDTSYVDYLRNFDAHDVHRGYFSIDKHGHAVDSKVGRGSDESDDESAYDLILKNKERLLSFDEPCRFIFSHSALREGWDNPNVFQICTLKHSDSETGKRQEVGRGLRLCVDQNGDRQDLQALGEEEVHKVNVLTVIASESYATFVDALQRDIREELRERPTIVDDAFFAGRTVTLSNGETVSFDEDESRKIYKFLIKNDYLDDNDRPSQEFKEKDNAIIYAVIPLPSELAPKAAAIEALVRSVYDPSALAGMVTNGLEDKVTENKLNDNFRKAEFQELWSRINSKHSYTVAFNDNELRRKAIARIDKDLFVSKLSYSMTVGVQHEKASRDDLESGKHFDAERSVTQELGIVASVGVTYDLIGEIAQAATITRRSAAAILSGINPLKFAMFKENPEEFIAKVSKIIIAEKGTMVIDHISYHTLDDKFESEIFTERMPENASRAYLAKKNIQNYVFPDGSAREPIETRFAKELDAHDEVCVYAKLPRTFYIPTPVGNYSPDWAIAFKKGTVKHIFFVAETKGSMDSLELRGVEESKIECAKKLFNEMSDSQVRYHNVIGYDDLMRVMEGME